MRSFIMAPKRGHPTRNQATKGKRSREGKGQTDRTFVQAEVLFEYRHMMVIVAERSGSQFAGIMLRVDENLHSTPYGLSKYQFDVLKHSLNNPSRQELSPHKVSSVVHRHADRLAESTQPVRKSVKLGSVREKPSYEELWRRNEELEDLVYRLRQLRTGSRPLTTGNRSLLPVVKKRMMKRSQKPDTSQGRLREVRNTLMKNASSSNVEHVIPTSGTVKAARTFRIEEVVASRLDSPAVTASLAECSLIRKERSPRPVAETRDSIATSVSSIRRQAFLKASGEKLWRCVGKRHATDPPATNAKRSRDAPQETVPQSTELVPRNNQTRSDSCQIKKCPLGFVRREESSSSQYIVCSEDRTSVAAKLPTRTVVKRISLRGSFEYAAAAQTVFAGNRLYRSKAFSLEETSLTCAFKDVDRENTIITLKSLASSKRELSKCAAFANGGRKNKCCRRTASVKFGTKTALPCGTACGSCKHGSPASRSRRACNSLENVHEEPVYQMLPIKGSSLRTTSGLRGYEKLISLSKRTCQYAVVIRQKNFESASATFTETRVRLTKHLSHFGDTSLCVERTLPAGDAIAHRVDLFVENVNTCRNLRRCSLGNPLHTFQAVALSIVRNDSAAVSMTYGLHEIAAVGVENRCASKKASSLASLTDEQEAQRSKERLISSRDATVAKSLKKQCSKVHGSRLSFRRDHFEQTAASSQEQLEVPANRFPTDGQRNVTTFAVPANVIRNSVPLVSESRHNESHMSGSPRLTAPCVNQAVNRSSEQNVSLVSSRGAQENDRFPPDIRSDMCQDGQNRSVVHRPNIDNLNYTVKKG